MQAGESLGPYAIVDRLGAGGMGEVWLGEDSRLGRRVAIKILPAEFAGDADRLARFSREARAAAALNHPHIAVVHDVGEAAGVHYLVQEYLQGASLRERLDAGALPLDAALARAAEVAAALAAAHRAGIVHRDLKPDNVFVTTDGHAKVLDFGLAKLVEPGAAGAAGASLSPTVLATGVGTSAGQILGTAGYMAPEQVHGLAVDGRADLFAFGALLYEMVTGGRAFPGETLVDTLHAVTRSEPRRLGESLPEAPAELERILTKCLRKDPDRRYQHADELTLDIEALRADVEAGRTGATAAGLSSVPAERSPVTPRLLAGALAIAVLAGASGWMLAGRGEAPTSTLRRLMLELGSQDRIGAGFTPALSLSRDGNTAVFVGAAEDRRVIFRRSLSEPASVAIAGAEGGLAPFLSPDGRWVGFFRDDVMLKVPIEGGVPVALTRVRAGWEWAFWTESDGILMSDMLDGLWKIDANGGERSLVAAPDEALGARGYFQPAMHPMGEIIAFTLFRGLQQTDVALLNPASGEVHVLLPDAASPSFAGPNWLLFMRDGTLHAAPFDARQGALAGPARPILRSVRAYDGLHGQYAVSDTGTLIYIPQAPETVVPHRLWWLDRSGERELLVEVEGAVAEPSFSPDGNRLAVARGADIWLADLTTNPVFRRWTFEAGNDDPAWSPDGESLVFHRSGVGVLRKSARDSLAPTTTIAAFADSLTVGGWTSDGSLIVAMQNDSWDVTLLPPGGDTATPVVASPFSESEPAVSADGRWLAYTSDQSGRREVYVRSIDAGHELLISDEGGFGPRWSPRGTELFYIDIDPSRTPGMSGAGHLVAVTLGTDPTPRIARRERLFDTSPYRVSGYAIDPRSGRFLFVATDEQDRPAPIQVVLGWPALLNGTR